MLSAWIGGIIDVSTVDYPGKISSVIFFCGCPFRCGFCQNSPIVRGEACRRIPLRDIMLELREYLSLSEAVVFTGGEPLMQSEAVENLARYVKNLGKLVKIDTNGFYPDELEKLLDLVDYVALDVKTSLQPGEYARICGLPEGHGEEIIRRLRRTIDLLRESKVFFEARTTVIPTVNDRSEIIEDIARNIVGCDVYVLQEFRPEMGTLDPNYSKLPRTGRERLLELARVAKKILADVRIRTIDGGEEIV